MSTRVLTRAEEDVIMERSRQVLVEDYTHEHDDGHTDGELARAAASYALFQSTPGLFLENISRLWPWDWKWWKPTTPRRNLVKAAALIVAEIERIDRMEDKS